MNKHKKNARHNPQSSIRGARFVGDHLCGATFVSILILLMAVQHSVLSATIPEPLQPFRIYASITAEYFDIVNTNNNDRVRSSIVMTWSNEVWEIEQTSKEVPRLVIASGVKNISPVRVTNCKKIQDGVRHYNLFLDDNLERMNDSLPLAELVPTPFPPIGERELLLAWLVLCPNPELPIVAPNKMKRFSGPDVFESPNNIGDYKVRYIDKKHLFLSALDVSDNGIVLELDGTVIHREKPFDKGFIDFKVEVIETTNVNSILFPKRATLKLLTPTLNAKTQADSVALLNVTLQVENINYGFVETNKRNFPLFVMDRRTPQIKDHIEVNYVVTNDTYEPKTNAKSAWLSSTPIAGRDGNKTTKKPLALIVLAAITIVPIVVWYRNRNHR